ncbi:DUF4179 domain-containing protein [Petroclostridium sp. X23]|uniref:DUF4179 domain-containing protein n=1 Tax=Petroclostridium sp. X23 TaxID=3045146 RepID=UPI0024AD6660|nr:DUF4179 domain-containing protein [Petroclostridium sp. X23]WHH57129.1 DUF4179 domain-containing protein [Petroclostridium sp. X23]
MKKAEDMLKNKKKELDLMEVPENLEARLRDALKSRRMWYKKGGRWKSWIAVAVIAILLAGYNFDTLAYYGKRLIGYDQIMNITLKELNELGKGQVVDKSYTFSNGVSVTLDGIMLDENRLIAFYTLKNSNGDVDDINFNPYISTTGFLGNYNMQGGQGEINEDKTEIRWMMDFDPPYFFEKTLHFKFAINDKDFHEEGKITFTLDRSKAMGYTLKKAINKNIHIDETKIHFEDILASPTRTVIKGSIQNIVGLAVDQIKGERFRPNYLDVSLMADGKEIQKQGSGMSTDLKGMTFHFDYDALPLNLETLQLKIERFSADHDVHQQIDLDYEDPHAPIMILDQRIDINKVYQSNGNTYITIASEESTILTRVHLSIDGKIVSLEKTTTDGYEKLLDGTILHTRTLEFAGCGKKLILNVQRISFEQELDKVINIPTN